MSDTPETDDHDQEHTISGYTLDFCRKLERERDEARNAFILAVDEMVKAQSQLREAKIEFDEARDTVATMEIRHAAAMFHAQRVVDDANQLREQRDMLADALRMIETFDYTDLQCDNGHGARSVATEALQSLTNFPQTPAE